ncbi:MAG: glycosyltransferase [Planctomycetes bacterium]|nr:glycosyltransferase [Planctomycetota bacterium]
MAKRKKVKSRSRQLPIVPVRLPRAPFVSVIIPVYNSADFLGQAIDSVMDQTFLDLEIIVVDDGSTDRTPEVAAQYRDHITYIRQPNGGNAAARNRGVVEARGRWLCFLDADDLWEPRKLERQLLDLLRHPEWMISFVRARKFFESGDSEPMPEDPSEGELWDRLVFYQPFGCSHSGMMLHSSCFERVGGFDDALRLSVDWDLFIRLADLYRMRVLPEFLVHHRQHSNNTTGNAELRLRMYLACLSKHRRLFCSKRGMRRQWHESCGERLFRFGRYYLKRRKHHRSLPLLLKSLRFGGRHQFDDKLKLLVECGLRRVGVGRLFDWAFGVSGVGGRL